MKLKSFAKQQSGFTLIELVVVIVILGILAATAIPRFVNMSVAARTAAVNGMHGAVQSAAALAHAQALVTSTTTSGAASVTMEGNNVALMNGYPTAAGIIAALASTNGFTVSTAGTTTTLGLTAAPTPATCSVSYTQAATAGGTPTIPAPNLAGCQ